MVGTAGSGSASAARGRTGAGKVGTVAAKRKLGVGQIKASKKKSSTTDIIY